MARSRSNPGWRLVNIALLASAASARTISLSSFELLSSIFITPACLDAYNTPLQGCELQDFLLGRECSRACISNLQTIETTIQQACSNANPRSGTLLSRTKAGDLVAALCGAEPVDGDNQNGGGQQKTTSTTIAQLQPGFTTGTTTVTKAITPKPAPTTTTTVQSLPPPASTSTDLRVGSSSISTNPPRTSLEPTASTQQPAPTLPPLRSTFTTSQAASNTAAPKNDKNGDNRFDDRPVGSGGGGLEDVGFQSSCVASHPSWPAALAAMAGAIIMAAL